MTVRKVDSSTIFSFNTSLNYQELRDKLGVGDYIRDLTTIDESKNIYKCVIQAELKNIDKRNVPLYTSDICDLCSYLSLIINPKVDDLNYTAKSIYRTVVFIDGIIHALVIYEMSCIKHKASKIVYDGTDCFICVVSQNDYYSTPLTTEQAIECVKNRYDTKGYNNYHATIVSKDKVTVLCYK